MILLQEIFLDERERWDRIIKSFGNYEPFYLHSYCSAMSKLEKARPILLFMEGEDIRAVNVIFERNISDSDDFREINLCEDYLDISSPYGYGGIIFEGDASKKSEIEKIYLNHCKKKSYISEFVRFNLFSGYESFFEGPVDSPTQNVICGLSEEIEQIWRSFEHKVRKNVKKGQKSKLQLLVDKNGTYLKEFLEIYYSTMERNNAQERFYFPEDFFKRIHEMEGNYIYFHVLYRGRIISSELILVGSHAGYSFLGGTDASFFAERPNDYLKFEIIKWLKENGYSSFVLGGGYGTDDGIFRYKKSFAPSGVVPFYIGKRIFDTKKYDFLCEQKAVAESTSNFFPRYRG